MRASWPSTSTAASHLRRNKSCRDTSHCSAASTSARLNASPWPTCARCSKSLGYTGVKTLLNSGNAVFTGGAGAPDKHARRIRAAVAKKLGVDASVIVKSDKDIAGIIAGNALDKVATNPSRLLVAMATDAQGIGRAPGTGRPRLGQGKGACRKARGIRLVRRWHSRKPGPGGLAGGARRRQHHPQLGHAQPDSRAADRGMTGGR